MKLVIGIVVSVGAVLLLGSAFAPVLCRSTETGNRVRCASNLRALGSAISLYENEHGGALPDSWVALLRTQDLVPEVLCCPSSNAEHAASLEVLAAGPTEKNCSYTFVGTGLARSDVTEQTVLAFEDLEDHDRDGLNILFGDGHVEFLQVNRKTPQAWYVAMTQQANSTTRPVKITLP